jgi:ribonuclease-3
VTRPSGSDRLARLQAALGYEFRDTDLLEQALTHRSYAHEAGIDRTNEPLEFLGDAVLGYLVADRIFRRRPDLDEGGMTRLRAALVNARSLAGEAAELGFGESMLLGRGEESSGGRSRPSLLADAFEAVIGAMLLDGGIRPVRKLVRRTFGARIEGARKAASVWCDAKTRLQEYAQAKGWELPVYRMLDQSGPDHARSFVIEVFLDGETRGHGEGTSKKRAEQRAAAEALERLGVE